MKVPYIKKNQKSVKIQYVPNYIGYILLFFKDNTTLDTFLQWQKK